MAEIIGVKFRDAGKVYYFDPDGIKFNKGDKVVVDTVRGVECGEIDMDNREVDDEQIVKPLRKVLRAATPVDMENLENNKKREKEAFAICQKKIASHNIDMKLVDVECTFDGSKVLFYFTAEGRVDFRELVRDLAGTLKTRIELRQIGVRDEAKLLGGLGICGRPFCCKTFLNDFQSVSIKMAKEQGLSLNPVKISGVCGRLMCCLKYEQGAYDHLIKITPRDGAIVETEEGTGVVTECNLLTGRLKVQLNSRPDAPPQVFNRSEVKVLRESKADIKRGAREARKKTTENN